MAARRCSLSTALADFAVPLNLLTPPEVANFIRQSTLSFIATRDGAFIGAEDTALKSRNGGMGMNYQALLGLTALCAVPNIVQAADFASTVGKTCRGYYKQSEGGTGSLQRPESAFKTGTVGQDGSFTLTAALAKPGASEGWETTNGNAYLAQGSTRFKLQLDGSLVFDNVGAFSSYRLTPVAESAPGTAFTIVYSHGAGTAVGKAVCSAS